MNNSYMKFLVSICLLLISGGILLAQDAAAAQPAQDPYFWDNTFTIMLVGAAVVVILGALGVLYRLLSEMIKVQQFQIYKEQGLEKYLEEVEKEPKANWWERFYRKMEGSVPMEKESDILLDHDYDGIRELDNTLPPWWVALFYITIAWGVVYYFYFHFTGAGPSSAEEYAIEMEKAEEDVAQYLALKADLVNESNVTLLTDPNDLSAGKATFKTLCATCHGQNGEGGVGPNFADDYWIHGCDVKDLFRTIKYGVPEKGMISWSSQLRPADMQKVASYILTLQGTNPPNPKDPQGEKCDAANENEAVDEATGDQLGMN